MRILCWGGDETLLRRIREAVAFANGDVSVPADEDALRERLAEPLTAVLVARFAPGEARLRRDVVAALGRGDPGPGGLAPDGTPSAPLSRPPRALVELGGPGDAADSPGAFHLVLPLEAPAAQLAAALRFVVDALGAVVEARARASRLTATLELTRRLASRHDFRDILFAAVRHIAEGVPVARASILLVEETAGELRVVATSDDPEIHDLRLEIDRYPEVREAVARRRAVYVADVSTDPRLEEVRRLYGTPSAAASYLFPVENDDGRVFGVLVLKTKALGLLDEEQLAACQAVASACAPALFNARTVQALEHQARGSRAERLEAEQRARALAKYARFFESAPDGLIVIDLVGNVLYANPQATVLLRGEGDDLPRHMGEVLDEDGRAALAALLVGFAAGRYPTIDLALVRRDGTRRLCQISSGPVEQRGDPCLLSVRDVTEERETAAELQRTKTFLERVVDSSVDGILAADMRGMIILFNRAAERIMGYRAPEVIGKIHIEKLYGSREAAREVMRRLRAEDHGGVGRLTQSRIRVVNRENEVIPVSISAAIIYEGDRELATCGIFTDLRERLRIEERLAQTQEKLLLTEKQAIVSEISGAMAHEINQPLTSVMGYAELLRKTLGDDDRATAYVDTILRETERMAELVKKIGRLTKYETTRYVGGAQILDLDRSADDSK